MSRRSKWLALVAAPALALTCAVACRSPHDPAPPPASASAIAESAAPPPTAPPATPEELALVSPLAAGNEVAGFTVRDIGGVRRGRMRVVFARKDAVVRLDVALVDPEGPVPPATAGRFAVYYSLLGATPEDGERLAKKLAAVIARNDVPPPAGMTTFKPDPNAGTEL